jgi:hypothetical protein
MRKRNKRKLIRPRATDVEIMILHCKPGAFTDRKKEKSKRKCRRFRHTTQED